MTVKQMPSASDDTMRNIMILLSSHNSHNGGSSVRTTERNFCSYVRHGKPQSLLYKTEKNKKGLIIMEKTNITTINAIEEDKVMNDVIMTNRIYNMDCLEGVRKMPDNSVDLIVSDPPYNFLTKNGKGTGVVKDSQYLKEIEYMSHGFDMRILDECVRVMKRINAFFFCSRGQIPMYIEYFSALGANIQLLTWSKTDVPPLCNGKYLSDSEYIIYAYEDSVSEKYTPITDHFITKKVHCNKNDPLYHPTKKPIDILSSLIRSASKENDIVLDMFSGSASTAVACIETGRKFIGFELMEKYYKVGNKRIAIALAEHPEYDSSHMPIIATENSIFDDNNMFNTIDNGDIDLAFFDICNREDIPFDLIERVISKQVKPNLYIMTDAVQFPDVLMYFVRQKYKYDIITVHRHNCTRYIIFLRKGGVKLYGTYHTKRKFFVDDRDMSLPCRDEIPPELFRRLLINSSLPGGVVFCSGGYGITVKECIAENRRFIAYEESNAILMHCVDAIKQSKLNLPDRYTGQEIYS